MVNLRARGKRQFNQTNYQGVAMAYLRTAEHRRRQAELVLQWKPWERSTGPRSPKGKAVASRNALSHGGRSKDAIAELKHLRKLLKELRITVSLSANGYAFRGTGS